MFRVSCGECLDLRDKVDSNKKPQNRNKYFAETFLLSYVSANRAWHIQTVRRNIYYTITLSPLIYRIKSIATTKPVRNN